MIRYRYHKCISTAKGDSGLRLSEIVEEKTGHNKEHTHYIIVTER